MSSVWWAFQFETSASIGACNPRQSTIHSYSSIEHPILFVYLLGFQFPTKKFYCVLFAPESSCWNYSNCQQIDPVGFFVPFHPFCLVYSQSFRSSIIKQIITSEFSACHYLGALQIFWICSCIQPMIKFDLCWLKYLPSDWKYCKHPV